jgi:hypothetical protein
LVACAKSDALGSVVGLGVSVGCVGDGVGVGVGLGVGDGVSVGVGVGGDWSFSSVPDGSSIGGLTRFCTVWLSWSM